nr:YopJ family acetyltransferase [uncultured Pseudomonas sp.]
MHIGSTSASASTHYKASSSRAEGSGRSGVLGKLLNLLPCSGRHMGIEPLRDTVLHNLGEIRDHLATLRQQNWSPSGTESSYDILLMPVFTKAERARNPNNTLTYLSRGFEALATHDSQLHRQVLLHIPNDPHMVAADVKLIDGKLSVIVADSLKHDSKFAAYDDKRKMRDMAKDLPTGSRIAVLCLDVQKASSGCRIMSLSAASKMAKEAGYFDRLHEANIREGADGIAKLIGAGKVAGTDRLDVFDVPQRIPTSLLKHIQARSSFRQWAMNQPPEVLAAPVNSLGATLQQRMGQRFVQRAEIRQTEDFESFLHHLNFSASIEDKRITYLERAMAFIQQADAGDVREAAKIFEGMQQRQMLPSERGLELHHREVGPESEIAKRLEDSDSEDEYSVASDERYR